MNFSAERMKEFGALKTQIYMCPTLGLLERILSSSTVSMFVTVK